MIRKSPTNPARAGVTRRSFAAGAGAGVLARTAPFNIVRAQGGRLKIGVILPLSGVQAGIGQSCKRGADIAPALFKQIGYTQPIEIVVVDFETNVDTARARAERLIADGCNMLSGPFDSGAASAIAQVAEQKGVPFVINIAAAPQITEQGYKFVFRNFQTAPQIISRGLALFSDIFAATGKTPSTAVLMHINDTFGQANKAAIDRIFPTMNLPFKIVESIAYDPAAKDLSVEVAKAKATNADILMTVTRLNDAIILVREMVKQRWEPMGIISPGSPGMYEQQFLDTMGKYGDYVITTVPWANPKAEMTKLVSDEFKKLYPRANNSRRPFHLPDCDNVAGTDHRPLRGPDLFSLAQIRRPPHLAKPKQFEASNRLSAKRNRNVMGNLFARKPLDRLMQEAENVGEHSLKRSLGPMNLIALGIGGGIWAGLFVRAAAGMAPRAGPPGGVAV